MEKYLDITKPRFSEHILPVPWHSVISRFHCTCFTCSRISRHWEHLLSKSFTGAFPTIATSMFVMFWRNDCKRYRDILGVNILWLELR